MHRKYIRVDDKGTSLVVHSRWRRTAKQLKREVVLVIPYACSATSKGTAIVSLVKRRTFLAQQPRIEISKLSAPRPKRVDTDQCRQEMPIAGMHKYNRARHEANRTHSQEICDSPETYGDSEYVWNREPNSTLSDVGA